MDNTPCDRLASQTLYKARTRAGYITTCIVAIMYGIGDGDDLYGYSGTSPLTRAWSGQITVAGSSPRR